MRHLTPLFCPFPNRGVCASVSSPPHSAVLLSRIFMFYHSTPSIRFVLSWRGRFPFRRFSVSASPPPHPVFHVSACVWFHSVFRVGGEGFRIRSDRGGSRGSRQLPRVFCATPLPPSPLCGLVHYGGAAISPLEHRRVLNLACQSVQEAPPPHWPARPNNAISHAPPI